MLHKTSVVPVAALMLFANVVMAENFNLQLEARAHYRDSADNRFATRFPFPPVALPVGQSSAFLETVESGQHVETSALTAAGNWHIADSWSLHFKVDAIDKYDRNPTSQDNELDLDLAFVRYGEHFKAMRIPQQNSFYAQVGKFAKFERQEDRATQSYGLLSTAFNRFEDSGVEAGFDLPSGIYGKLSWTTGNPVFIRDANALAGDNGTDDRRVPPDNPDPNLKSGIVLLYDSEIEDFDLSSDPEQGLALGYRWNSPDNRHTVDVMGFGYHRELAEDRQLHGTFYGADLDLLDLGELPGAGAIRLPVDGNEKREYGANLWYQVESFSLFAQYVDQDMAGLERDGVEVELSYRFDLPVRSVTMTPVVRYSKINNNFMGDPRYPAPSVWWDWKKLDYGVNVGLPANFNLIVEYADNRFLRGENWQNNNELLVTLEWKLRHSW